MNPMDRLNSPGLPPLRRSLLRSGLATLLLLPLAAALGQGKGPYTLRLKFKTGETRDYATTLQLTLILPNANKTPTGRAPSPTGIPQQFNLLQHYKVLKAVPNGNADLEITTSGASAFGSSPAGGKPMRVTLDPYGKIVAVAAGSGSEAASPSLFGAAWMNMLSAQGLHLPSKPVKPGDTWTEQIKIPQTESSGTLKCRFVKLDTVGKYQTAHIESVLSLPLHFMTDADRKPTQDASKAALTTTGTLAMTYENDLAISEGKLVRVTGNGSLTTIYKAKGMPQAGTAGSPSAPKTATINAEISLTTILAQK